MRIFELKFKNAWSDTRNYTASIAIESDGQATICGAIPNPSKLMATMENINSLEETAKELRKTLRKSTRENGK